MVRRLIRLVCIFFLSWEAVTVLVAVVCYYRWPTSYQWLGERLLGMDDRIRYLCFLPTAALIYVVRSWKEILHPKESIDEVLCQWPKYQELRDTYMCAVVFCAASCLAGLTLWTLNLSVADAIFMSILLVAIVISFISSSTVFIAVIAIRGIVGGYR